MSRVIRHIDRGTRMIDGVDVHLTEFVSDDDVRSFGVHRTDTGADLTEDKHLDTWPNDDHLADLLHAQAGQWVCADCATRFDSHQRDLIADHVRDCETGNRTGAAHGER